MDWLPESENNKKAQSSQSKGDPKDLSDLAVEETKLIATNRKTIINSILQRLELDGIPNSKGETNTTIVAESVALGHASTMVRQVVALVNFSLFASIE